MNWKQVLALIAGALAIAALLALYEPVTLLAVGVLLLAICLVVPNQ